jgi:UDP-N-acetylglucosamine 2-epimerase (non-hydrolysing)
MSKTSIHLIAAARPNFMKIAPLFHALEADEAFEPRIVHTGQHYDPNMSAAFFEDLQLPEPHFHLNIGSGSHAEQTAGVMLAYEKICLTERPDWVVVVGDVNPTATVARRRQRFLHGTGTAGTPARLCETQSAPTDDPSFPVVATPGS